MNNHVKQLDITHELQRLHEQCNTTTALTIAKQYLTHSADKIQKSFFLKKPVRYLVQARSFHIDALLTHLNRYFALPDDKLTIIAVGGYGRGELHPGSDIDLLFLIANDIDKSALDSLQVLITFLWDIGLEIGHSVRTLPDCIEKAKSDVTIVTNLMESRRLVGNKHLYDQLKSAIATENMWSAKSFYDAKIAEQKARYRKYKGSSFDLEPNIKGSPGGLRDIQLVGWIAKRNFATDSLHELANQGVFTLKEYRTLMGCQMFLWRTRFALHCITKRGEDRLLFQHQKSVAEQMGFKDKKEALAVEQFMKKYFRAVITVRNVTELLLQAFEEVILENNKIIVPIDEHFQLENDRISLINPDIVKADPSFIFRTFITAANIPGNKHVSAQTLRAIRDNRHLIDSSFRNNERYKALFLEFFSINHKGDRPLFLMKRNGIIARFIPAFEQISGQMQFDMFHSYTVDEHTIFLLKNLTRFNHPDYQKEFSVCSRIMKNIEKPQIIFLAGLFHDIAKGRGGDHSELGAIDAYKFCTFLGMPKDDAKTVSWLVECHLIMSVTAQRKDISDPEVIANFSLLVKNQNLLDLLYVLTVADIRATSPKLWNSWKDALLRELYLATSHYLQQGDESRRTTTEHIQHTQKQALGVLSSRKVSPSETRSLWNTLDDDYFLCSPYERVIWQSESIIKHAHGVGPLVEIKRHHNKGGTEIFIYIQDQPDLFATITATLSQKNLSIQAAELHTNSIGMCLDTFIVLEESGLPISSSTRIQSIKKILKKNLRNISGVSKQVYRRTPSKLKQFNVPTEVRFFNNDDYRYSQIELTALDQPGLLARIGEAFKNSEITVHSAKISTLGEKVEDTFLVSDHLGERIDSIEDQEMIRQHIINELKQY